jgi:hypothetical protein
MKFTKKNLLHLLQENLKEAPMRFDTQDRPDPGVQQQLSRGETSFKNVPLPSPEEGDINFQELLASERYRQVVNKVKEYTGIDTPMVGEQGVMPLSQMMMSAHNQIIRAENEHRSELERLAVELVIKEMGIPEGKLQFDVKIVGLGEIDTSDFQKGMGEQPNIEPIEIEQDLMNDLEKLNLERAKRRLINSMVQGSSKKGHYMYHMVDEKIRQITGSDDLINQYGVLMSINDTLYWQLSDDTMQMMMGGGGGGGVGGKEKVDRNTTPPTIYARGINFPILIHEIIKGIMELFAIQGQPEDEEISSRVSELEDTMEKEIWDLRLGPAIWDRIRSQFPEEIVVDENKRGFQNFLLTKIFKLPARQFLVFMKEVISGSEQGKRLMEQMLDAINQMFSDIDYENAMSQFDDDLDQISDNTDDDELDDFLGSLGITRPDE